MDKAIGFRRNIYLDWMDAAAAFAAEGVDAATMRLRLDPIVAQTVESRENRRMALDILINIWIKNSQQYPELCASAYQFYGSASDLTDRLWIHYGMCMLAYPFFEETARVVGQFSAYQDTFATSEIKRAMIAERGHLGALDKAVERVLFSLRNWGILTAGAAKSTFAPVRPRLQASNVELQLWMVAVALTVRTAEELPYVDLIRLPELFPFVFSLSLDQIRRHPWFAVQRQGAALDMVRLVEMRSPLKLPAP